MLIVNIYSVITVVLILGAILIRLHLNRKKNSLPYLGKSVAIAGYAFSFFLVGIFFAIILTGIQFFMDAFSEYAAAWLALMLFCCVVAITVAILITSVFEKDIRGIQQKTNRLKLRRPSPPESIPLHFSLVMVDVGEITSTGIKLATSAPKWYDKYITVIQMIVWGFIVFYWLLAIKGNPLIILGASLFLIIVFTNYEVRRVQRAVADKQFADVFLSALLLGMLYSLLNYFGIILLLNGIRLFVSLIRHIRTQNLTANSIYINLNTFSYFYILFIFLNFMLVPSLSSDFLMHFPVFSSDIVTIWHYFIFFLPWIATFLVTFIYWVMIGRHITAHQYSFIGKRSTIIIGLVTSPMFGIGIPFLLFGVLKYFEAPINTYFSRWRENPRSAQSIAKKNVNYLKVRKEEMERNASAVKKGLDLLKHVSNSRTEKLRTITKVNSVKQTFLKPYTAEFKQLLPVSVSVPVEDAVQFSVFASELQEVQLASNNLEKKTEKTSINSSVEYIGNLPGSMQGLKVFIPPFFLEELIQKRQALGANVPITFVSPTFPATSAIDESMIQDFIGKNSGKVTIDFIDPSQFDLEMYRHILLMFHPTLDSFHVAESVAYMNATKLGALLVPNIDWLFVQDLIRAGKIPATHIPKALTFILPAQKILPPPAENQLPTSVLPPETTQRIFAIKDTPEAFSMRLLYVSTLTMFILIMFAGIYFLLERIGLAPIIYLQGGLPFSPGETVIVFILWTGAIIFLSLYLYFKVTNLPLRGLHR